MQKKRLDVLLVERGMAASRSLAQRLIMAGKVIVNQQRVEKPSVQVDSLAQVTLVEGARYVSRGGEKLEAALNAFGLARLEGLVCVDVGASTGGFTDCLLQHGASRVYALDVGYGVLHWQIRQDARVVVMERTNARFVKEFDAPIDLVTVDASFISLKVLLPVIRTWLSEGHGQVVALIKPQFEAGKKEAARGEGVIRDPEIHKTVLADVLAFSSQLGFIIRGLIRSPLIGPKGNAEFLLHLGLSGSGIERIEDLVNQAAHAEPVVNPRTSH